MQEKQLYEYAIIRVVPKVERDEFLNVGLILYCAKQKFLKARFELNTNRLEAAFGNLDFAELENNLCSFQRISEGGKQGGPIALLDMPSRFRWLTAKRSTVVQTSRVCTGLSSNIEKTFEKLFSEQVSL
ncbi:DUF3037 domain-containing protein [Solitalea sp. MAHUQ-68]|uniref:DUF3037 domain-containing protein n=1 Tax=Solitalea agri TaxID=2953739 RepID=A0A9X2F5H0_9SPHI|nr:DUF3037 domain-containing protein [Solitalea agri]MCO4294470.1 DUF3037 domain-containing protein [Solitalea agri]